MPAWATVKVTTSGAASTAPLPVRGPAAPAGTVSVSVEVGMNGAVAAKVSVAGADCTHEPDTGGFHVGMPTPATMGAEKRTDTGWSDDTPVVPLAGVADTTVSALIVVVGGGFPLPVPPL